VLSQSFKDFELILIDDGSKDGSGKICDRYRSQDSRVVVKHINNGGMCHARNLAIDSAKGEYIAFCDDDDVYLPKLLEDNYALAKKCNADVVRFQRELYLYDDKSESPRVSTAGPSELRTYRGKEIFQYYGSIRSGSDGVWNGLYRRDFLNRYGIRFDEKMHSGCEDNLFNTQCYSHANTVATNPKAYYRWSRRASHSTSFKISENFYYGLKTVVNADRELMNQHGVSRAYFGNRMVSYSLSPLEVALLKRSYTDADLKEICIHIKDIFGPFSNEIVSCPLRASYSFIFNAAMKENIALVKFCLVMSRMYLAVTKIARR